MEFDLSRLVLLLLAVLPGYEARQGSSSVLPRSDKKPGATEEVASFVAMSAVVHLILIVTFVILAALYSVLYCHLPASSLGAWLATKPDDLWAWQRQIAVVWYFFYFAVSMIAGRAIGMLIGLLGASSWNEQLFRKFKLVDTRFGRFWSRHVDRFLLSGPPILYSLLLPQLDAEGKEKTVYAEIELKAGKGTITGRVISFSTSNDEEPHKLIYLQEVHRKNTSEGPYQKLPADGMLLDLADTLTIQVKQV